MRCCAHTKSQKYQLKEHPSAITKSEIILEIENILYERKSQCNHDHCINIISNGSKWYTCISYMHSKKEKLAYLLKNRWKHSNTKNKKERVFYWKSLEQGSIRILKISNSIFCNDLNLEKIKIHWHFLSYAINKQLEDDSRHHSIQKKSNNIPPTYCKILSNKNEKKKICSKEKKKMREYRDHKNIDNTLREA